MINDPHLDGSGDVNAGLHMARGLLLEVLSLGIPTGSEFLDPITPQYISDAVAWAAIGARTTESQIHRNLASGLSMPVGFKNGTAGNVGIAVDAARAAASPHAFTGVTLNGSPRDPAHARERRRARHPAGRARGAELRRSLDRDHAGRPARGRVAGAGRDRRLARQQRQGPKPPAGRGHRRRGAGRGGHTPTYRHS